MRRYLCATLIVAFLSCPAFADIAEEVQSCWNVGLLSTAALRISVTVSFSTGPGGAVDRDTIRLEGSSGGSKSDVREAFEAARKAISRCGNITAAGSDHRRIWLVFNVRGGVHEIPPPQSEIIDI